MAVDMFLKVDGIPGECQKDKHVNEIDILSFQFGTRQNGSFATGGKGGGAGKAEFTDLTIVKNVDKSSPKLFEACAAGTHIKEVIITAQRAGDKPVVYYKVTLSDVIVSGTDNSGASSGDALTEQVSFNFAVCKFEYTEQTEKGGAGAKTLGGFSIREGKKV